MEEHTLSYLIDQYLLGTISPGDRKQLEERMAADPSFAELVHDSKEAYKALIHARHLQLREKLRKLDKDDMKQSGFAPKWFGWFAFLLLLLLLYVYMAFFYFNPSAIARRNFIHPDVTVSPYSGHPFQKTLKDANEAFLAKDYQTAIVLFESLAAPDTAQDAYNRWHILLSQLALEGPTSNWKAAMDLFLRDAPEPYASKGGQLTTLFDSWMYNFFYVRMRDNLSAIKPKLI